MSARMVRRALQEQESQKQSSRVEESTDDEVEESPPGKRAQNLFSFLGSEEIEDEEAEDEVVMSSKPPQISKIDAPATNASKSKKKSKGKRKGKSSTSAIQVAEEESVDELLERFALQNEGSVSTSTSATVADVDPFEMLAVNPRSLRAEDEFRRIFGSKVINEVERSGRGTHAGRKRQGHHRGLHFSLKKTLLVAPHEHWPRPEGGLSMECVETRDGLSFFRYVFSSSYQEVQKQYEECSASHDPNTIVMMVNRHPYHIDSLLTLAELYKHMGESQRSADLLERCLYALEYAWHPLFNVTTGRCRLDFGWDPNKLLFVALFKHMQLLDKRGCHRTALEVCKLLLSLDSDDPMGSLFCIDYYAIRAEQYQWLQKFIREYGNDRSLSLLPSLCFSLALAVFHAEGQNSAASSSVRELSSRDASLGEEESSTELLQQALMLHPAFLKKIVEKAPVKEDAAWAKILKHHHFSKATSDSPTLEHLINIYVARNYLVWRPSHVQAWLKESAQAVVGIADSAASGHGGWEIANWACVRKEAFPAEENEYRHLLVSDFSDAAATLPPEELQQFFPGGPGNGAGNGAGDGAAEVVMAEAAVQARQLEYQNALLLFLHSLLPWVNQGVDMHGLDPPPEE